MITPIANVLMEWRPKKASGHKSKKEKPHRERGRDIKDATASCKNAVSCAERMAT